MCWESDFFPSHIMQLTNLCATRSWRTEGLTWELGAVGGEGVSVVETAADALQGTWPVVWMALVAATNRLQVN